MASNDDDTPSWHGLLGHPSWSDPICTLTSTKLNRVGYDGAQTASEYNDQPDTLEEKVKTLADLIRVSSNFIAYTGAGISTSSGIGDYASAKPKDDILKEINTHKSAPKLTEKASSGGSPLRLSPSLGHFAITELYKAGYLKQWIQQNHDGLPQKAGAPQHVMNEIHGGWFDPSNPVVKMAGNLRPDLFSRLLKAESDADLCLSVGTSMVGMNADRVFTTVASKAVAGDSKALGGVIINKQKTQHDGIASLRIFADINHVFKLLMDELGLELPDMSQSRRVKYPAASVESDGRIKLPLYDATGERAEGGLTNTTLNLAEGAMVKLTDGPYAGDQGEVVSCGPVYYTIRFQHKLKKNNVGTQPMERALGRFMVEALVNGELEKMPIVNV